MADSVVTLVGNLTREPEMRFTPSGAGQSLFGIAVNYRRPDRQRQGEWIEETSFFNIVCWGTLAENVQGLAKGTRVIVTGRIQQRSWETEQGEKRSVVEIVADEVAPSLRWASAEVRRVERRGGDFGGGGGGGGGRQTANEPAAPYDGFGDEEPF